MDKFQYKNVMQVPRVDKIIINIGVGEAIQNPKALDAAVNDLSLITGQKPVITKAKKSIAGFKLREGMSIGCKVTLRGERMYQFLDKLINVVLPRVRDFRGVSPQLLMGAAIILWESRNRPFSRKLNMTKLTRFGAWKSLSLRQPRPMKKHANC
jgi:large subunit ribosomal protein L5